MSVEEPVSTSEGPIKEGPKMMMLAAISAETFRMPNGSSHHLLNSAPTYFLEAIDSRQLCLVYIPYWYPSSLVAALQPRHYLVFFQVLTTCPSRRCFVASIHPIAEKANSRKPAPSSS